jgi:hypothetical protein
MADLTAILSKKASEIEPPKQLPVGQYMFSVLKWEQGETSNKNPKITFTVNAIQALEVDDTIELPVSMRLDFVLTEAAAFRIKNFLSGTLGLGNDDSTLGELLQEANGKLFRGSVIHRLAQNDASRLYANIAETFPAE